MHPRIYSTASENHDCYIPLTYATRPRSKKPGSMAACRCRAALAVATRYGRR